MAQDGTPRQWTDDPTEHRELWTVDPPQRGRDVANVQRATRDRLDARSVNVPVAEHGEFTLATAAAAIEAQYFLGLRSETYLREDAEGHRCLTVGAQRIIRNPGERTEVHLQRARDRQGQLERGPRYWDDIMGGSAGGEVPRIVGWDETRISPDGVFGPLGAETRVTPHYAASPRARNLSEGISLTRQFDRFHRSKGWGGCSYAFLIPDSGELILGRSTLHKGAHVLGYNSNNVGINFFGSTGDEPTEAQARTYLWLLANAHTDTLPSRHRTDRDLRKADIRGHNQWPRNFTGCPGRYTPANLARIGA